MAHEAIKVEGPYEIHSFTVATGTNIPLHTLCKLSDPRTAAASASTDVWAGIAASEKSILNDDASDTLGLYTRGIFNLYAGGGSTITVGGLVKLSGANIVEGGVVEADIIAGKVVGKSLQAVATGTPEQIDVMVGCI